jgi:hypothetical protein
MAKLTVVVDDALMVRLRMVALREGKSVSEIIRGFVKAYVERREQE